MNQPPYPIASQVLQCMLADALQAGRFDAAAQMIRQALDIDKHQPVYHCNLGIVVQAQGKLDEAAACYERALALKPDLAEVHIELGNIFQTQGKLEKSVACYERALALKPDYLEAHNNLGVSLMSQGRIADAITHYRRALELNPGHANSHANLGVALAAQGRIADAITHYECALELNPRHANAHNNLGIALVAQCRIADGITHYERALELNPDDANAHSNLGVALMAKGKTDEAMAHYRRALGINPDHPEALNNLGNALKEEGRFDDALNHFGRAIAVRPDYAEPHFNRSEIKSFHPGDADLMALEALAESNKLSTDKKTYIHFALAKALEDTGDYIRAFEHLRTGNALKRSQINYDEASVRSFFERTAAVFDRRLLDRFQGSGNPSSIPVFVLGMPRSGSTLVEQILASHPQIHGAGELEHLENMAGALRASDPPLPYPECVPALDGTTLHKLGEAYLTRLPAVANGVLRIVDKAPGNFLLIGLIRLMLPNAKIIHTRRHPIDTCLSCYSRLFASGLSFTYDLAELGRYYRYYTELMTHWRSVLPPEAILDVSYEDIVYDLKAQARRLIDYCGLRWDDGCLAFHRTTRTVKTASAVQVRQPLFGSSLQRWRKYEAGLAPLLRVMQNAHVPPACGRGRNGAV
jgi:tetratricopeptide (TPR) repeat protein